MTLLICWAANWKISFMSTGLGVENILAAVIERIPPPKEMLMSHYKSLTPTTIHFVELKLFSV
jgi:translation elongation factor EF-4